MMMASDKDRTVWMSAAASLLDDSPASGEQCFHQICEEIHWREVLVVRGRVIMNYAKARCASNLETAVHKLNA